MMDGDELKALGRDFKDLKELVEFLKANEIAEFEVERDDLKLRLKFAGVQSAAQSGLVAQPSLELAQLARMMAAAQPETAPLPASPMSAAALSAGAAAGAPSAGSAAPVAAVAEVKHHVLKSPIVGTFYESPSPGSPPFVKVGDTVEVGQVLCIVEAMKLMNEIESDAAGELMERIAVVGQPVEYGQPLFSIKI